MIAMKQSCPTNFTITLPMPPALNRAFRSAVTRQGRPYSYKSSAAKRWQQDAWFLIRNKWHFEPMEPPIIVDVFIDPIRDRDIDSSAKLLLDTLQEAGVYKNDMKIVSLHLHKPIERTKETKSDSIVVSVVSIAEVKSNNSIAHYLLSWIEDIKNYVARLGATPKKPTRTD